jgi:hypothetical protein
MNFKRLKDKNNLQSFQPINVMEDKTQIPQEMDKAGLKKTHQLIYSSLIGRIVYLSTIYSIM